MLGDVCLVVVFACGNISDSDFGAEDEGEAIHPIPELFYVLENRHRPSIYVNLG